MTNIINGLASAFDSFLTNISNGDQWTYIFIGLTVFIILLDILCNMIRGWK